MGTRPWSLLFALCALLAAAAIQVCSGERSITVVGSTECLDCAEKSIKNEDAVKGLRVAINCKASSEQYETQGTAEIGSGGDFAVKLPAELLTEAGELKHECFAQLHAKSNKPCPGKNGLVPSKLVLRSKDAASGEHTFAAGPSGGKLSFSSATCASATFWPCPPLSWKKKLPKFHVPYYKHHEHPHPEYKPAPSHGGYYKPPAPEYKPPSPSGGYYSHPTPSYSPPSGGGYYNPPAQPAYKPSPETFHHDHHEHPMLKKPLPPFHHHEHPMLKKPLPPFHHGEHPMFKKPLPPFHHGEHPEYPPVKGHRN